MAEQTHSCKVKIVNINDAGAGFTKPYLPIVDALITQEKNLFLVVKTADCVPILLYDKINKVIAAVHSGRKGTEKNIIFHTLKIFFEHFFCKAENIVAKIGPSISGENYPLNKNEWENFVGKTKVAQIFPYIDLSKVIKAQLKENKILQENITHYNICTYANQDYFSYRENHTMERQISLIGVN